MKPRLFLFTQYVLPLIVLCCGLAATSSSVAQDYRIYSRITHQETGNPESKPEVIARSLTLWHAGKVYDYMDGAGELVVYDPQLQRYTIISGPHMMACTVEFSEVRQFLKVARNEAKEYLTELSDSNLPQARKEAERIAFLLDPKFQVNYQAANKILVCDSNLMSYTIQGIPSPNRDITAAFRQYADWAAQLNFVLHGQSLLPEARMQVNQVLEEQQLIPAKVTLLLKDQVGTTLTAEHTIHWELGQDDLSRWLEWDKLIKNEQLRFVSFHEYQRNLLTQYSSR